MNEATRHAHTHTSGADSSPKVLMDTEAQRGGVICPRSHSKQWQEPRPPNFHRHSLIRPPEHTPVGCGQRQGHLAVWALQQREQDFTENKRKYLGYSGVEPWLGITWQVSK